MNTHKVGLSLGLFVGLMHLIWEILIFFGLAQDILSFKFSMHSLNNPFVVESFNLGRGIGLVIFSMVMAYIVGSVFATIYNKVHR